MSHGHSGGDVAVQVLHSEGLTTAEVEQLRPQWGYNEIADRSKKWYQVLFEQVYGDHWYPNAIPAMMWTAMIIAAAIQDWADAGVIFGLHCFNSGLSYYETMKAGDAVTALRSALAPSCNVKRDGQWKKIMAKELINGDLVMLKLGDVIPADGVLCNGGTMDIDQSGLTGESLPVKKKPGDTMYSGTIVKRGESDFIVNAIGEYAEIGKGVKLIMSVESKGQVEVIMNRITIFLLIYSISINIILIIVEATKTSTLHLCNSAVVQRGYILFNEGKGIQPTAQANNGTDPAINLPYNGGVYYKLMLRGCNNVESDAILANFVVLMIAAIPIATPVVVTATMAIGARKMASQNAVVTRLSAIEELAGMTTLCSDKTGTLTKNVLTIDSPWLCDGTSGDDLVFKSALAAKNVDPDAIDKCILNSVRDPAMLKQYQQVEFVPFDPMNRRTEATIKGPDGKIFKTSKGAPNTIYKMCWNADAIAEKVDKAVEEFANRGARAIAVAQTREDGQWCFLGLISLFDPPRDDTKIVIESALRLGSAVKMITGDHLLIAKETCRRLGMGDQILRVDALKQPRERLLELIENVDGFAEVFPEDKFDIVALFQAKGHITGMTGDGVNDAPALRKANVGFAVEGATPAAQGAASVILLTPGLSVIITAIQRSRKIFQRLQNYITYRVYMSVFLLLFFFIAISSVDFRFPPVLIIFMCLILDLATMSLAYDKVFPSAKPNQWKLVRLILLASVIGLSAAMVNLIFLSLLLNGNSGLSTLQHGKTVPCGAGYTGNGGSNCQDVANSICLPLLARNNFVNISKNPHCNIITNTPNCNDNAAMLFLLNVHPLCALKYDTSLGLIPNNTFCSSTSCPASYSTVSFFGSNFPQPGMSTDVTQPIISQTQYNQLMLGITLNPYNNNFNGLQSASHTFFTYSKNYAKVPETFDFSQHPYQLNDFPYSSAVINTVLFLSLCISSQSAVFVCRVEDWFWTRRPGYVLLAIIASETLGTSLVAAFFPSFPFWDTNPGGSLTNLTGLSGSYMGVGWLVGIICFVFMELFKKASYKLQNVFDSQKIENAKKLEMLADRRRRMTNAEAIRRETQSRAVPKSSGTFGKKPVNVLQQKLISNPTYGHDSDL